MAHPVYLCLPLLPGSKIVQLLIVLVEVNVLRLALVLGVMLIGRAIPDLPIRLTLPDSPRELEALPEVLLKETQQQRVEEEVELVLELIQSLQLQEVKFLIPLHWPMEKRLENVLS